MRIGDAAAAAGTTPRALRFYEERGLLSPRRSPTGQREYEPGDVARVRVVRQLLALGLTVEDIRACAAGLGLLGDDGLPLPGEASRGRCGLSPGVAEQRIDQLDAEIARLTGLRQRLARRLTAIRAAALAPGDARGTRTDEEHTAPPKMSTPARPEKPAPARPDAPSRPPARCHSRNTRPRTGV
ncbi:MerR family transcriptional regulator [Streptomyces alboflavus]|uniref:MerR family transcriptional regulator n=1 Tax=Streptomyces alboflavus TaxID=67267 RepID=UPI0007C4E3A0